MALGGSLITTYMRVQLQQHTASEGSTQTVKLQNCDKLQ